MDNKDEILANFQACSGIEDVGEAFMHLEAADWNLMDALRVVMPMDQSAAESPTVPSVGSAFSTPVIVPTPNILPTMFPNNQAEVINIDSSPEVSFVGRGPSAPVGTSVAPLAAMVPTPPTVLPTASTSTQASTSHAATPVMDVHIQVLCGGASEGNSFPLELPGSTTVGELRTMLHQLVGITPCNQVLEGFQGVFDNDSIITPSLLPENRTLTLNTSPDNSFMNYFEGSRVNGDHTDEYILLIHDETNVKDYRLSFSGSKRIKDIKGDIRDLTNIQVRHQQWTGWPQNTDEENATLATSGVSKQHHLTVRKLNKEKTPKLQRKVQVAMDTGDDNSSGDEFEDAAELLNEDDDFLDMMDVPSSKKPQTLIPADVDDEVTGVIHFCEEFRNRYGNSVPQFFEGKLEDALKESVVLPAKNRKLLAVYLHHDGSVLSNVFCSQALCQASIVDYLVANFVVWGWDLTHEANKARLLNLVTTHFGTMAASTVRSINVDRLPALLVITRTRGTIEVLSVIHGNTVLDELMTSLLHATEMFEEQRETEVGEENAREAREAIKNEQDIAYEMSLQADRAKAEAKRMEEERNRVTREREESVKAQEDALKAAVRESLESDLPPEPSPNSSKPITTLRFRIPGGDTFTRLFLQDTQLQVLLNFLHVKGYAPDEFKCLQSWPRRDITSLDTSKTLLEYKLCPQETLNIEER